MRVSYSILASWAQGDIDRAVAPFVGTYVEPNEYMIEGKKLHEAWEAETEKTGAMPKLFGGAKLVKPLTEKRTKKAVLLPAPYDWIEFVCVLDVLHGPGGKVGVDYKMSRSKVANDFLNSFQHRTYQLVYPTLERFDYCVYNPSSKTTTYAMAHLTKQTLTEGIEFIITHTGDLRNFLEQENISIERQGTK